MKNNTLLNILIPPTDEKEILDYWNELFTGVKEVTKHRNLSTSVWLKNSITGEKYKTTVGQIITNALLSFKKTGIEDAINNYYQIYTSKDYYYKVTWNLSSFLAEGKFTDFFSSSEPFVKYKKTFNNGNSLDDPMKDLAKGFAPLTITYDKQLIFDKSKSTYYGFNVSKLRKYKQYKSDLDYLTKNTGGVSNLGELYFLELVIVGLLFFRKKEPNVATLAKYLKMWQEGKTIITRKEC